MLVAVEAANQVPEVRCRTFTDDPSTAPGAVSEAVVQLPRPTVVP